MEKPSEEAKKINEEIKQFKLSRIQATEEKVKGYQDVYETIKEDIVIKVTKNATSRLIRFVLALAVFVFLLLAIACFFPEWIISLMESEGEYISSAEKTEYLQAFHFWRYFLLSLAVFIWVVRIFIKKNIEKRNIIFEFSILLEDAIEYMTASVDDEKKKYEYFIDNMMEIEVEKKQKEEPEATAEL